MEGRVGGWGRGGVGGGGGGREGVGVGGGGGLGGSEGNSQQLSASRLCPLCVILQLWKM